MAQAKRKKNVNPAEGMEPRDVLLAQYLAYTDLDPKDAYRIAYPRSEGEKADPNFTNKWQRKIAEDTLQNLVTYLRDATDEEIARDFLRRQILNPEASETVRKGAAEAMIKLEERAQAGEGFDRWMRLMLRVGAEVRKPIPRDANDVTVRLADLVNGDAWIELPPKARMELLHLAGAPWNDQDPNARLSDLQVELLSRDERMVLCNGGSGVGKSVTQGAVALFHVCIPNQKIAIIASTYDKCLSEFQYAWRGFMQLFGKDGACTTKQRFNAERGNYNMEIETIWGSFIQCFSTDNESGAQILGREFDIVVYGEGSLVSAEIHQRKVVRAVMRRVKRREGTRDPNYYRRTGRIYGCSTPDGYAGCISEEWDRVQRVTGNQPERLHVDAAENWLDSAYLREATALENPAYSKEAFEAARKALPPDIFAEQFLGRRVRRSGIIYQEWDESTMLVTRPTDEALLKMRLSVGFDTGKHFSAGIWGYDEEGVLWRLGEVCGVERKISDNAGEVMERCLEVLGPAFNARTFEEIRPHVDIWPCDPHSQHKMELMDELGAPIMDAIMPVQGSIDRLRKLMAEGRFRVVREFNLDPIMGMGFRYEIAKYVWKVVKTAKGWQDGRTKLEPVKMEDHSMDEARYGAVPLLELGKPSKAAMTTVSREPSLGSLLRQQMVRQGRAGTRGEAYRRIHAA